MEVIAKHWIQFKFTPIVLSIIQEMFGNGICDGVLYNAAACKVCGGGGYLDFDLKYPGCEVEYPYLIGNGFCNSLEYNSLLSVVSTEEIV